MTIIGIDPGQERSGVVTLQGDTVVMSEGSMHNDEVLRLIRQTEAPFVVCEIMSAIRASVGVDTFQTCYFIGRIMEATYSKHHGTFNGIEARAVKKALIGTVSGKSSLVRKALIHRYAYGLNDFKDAHKIAIGTNKHPGPLYGVTDHAWSALAVVVTYLDQQKTEEKNGTLESRYL